MVQAHSTAKDGEAGRSERSELRRFAWVVGPAFLILGALQQWRHGPIDPRIGYVAGGLLLVTAAAAPMLLRPVYRGWMALSHRLGAISTFVTLTVIFYLLFTPTAWVQRLVRRDRLGRRFRSSPSASYWRRRPPAPFDREGYERQS